METENSLVLREAAKDAQMAYFNHLAGGGKRDPDRERWIKSLTDGADAITRASVLASRLKQVERERDALMYYAKGCCTTCAFRDDCAKHDLNDSSPYGERWYYGDCEDWEWRGVCGENTKENETLQEEEPR